MQVIYQLWLADMYQIEKQSLEAHVELCAERYRALEQRLDQVDNRIDSLSTLLMDIDQKLDVMTERTQGKWDRVIFSVMAIMATVIGVLISRYVL